MVGSPARTSGRTCTKWRSRKVLSTRCVSMPRVGACTASSSRSASCARWYPTPCSSASSSPPRARSPTALFSISMSQPGAARCRTCQRQFELHDLILLCPCGSADVEVHGRPRPADPLDGSELTMCATCGCGDDSAVITLAGHEHERHDHSHDHDHHDHDHITTTATPTPRRSRWSRRFSKRTIFSPSRTADGWPSALSSRSTSPAHRAQARRPFSNERSAS